VLAEVRDGLDVLDAVARHRLAIDRHAEVDAEGTAGPHVLRSRKLWERAQVEARFPGVGFSE